MVTHIARSDSVDPDRALAQWRDYCSALSAAGFELVEVDPAPEHPDSVFIEDALVVVGDLAVVTAPGAPERRDEVIGARAAARALGLEVVELAAQDGSAKGEPARDEPARDEPAGGEPGEPVHLDGGDVLKVGSAVYVGVGGRTTQAGVQALARAVAGTDHTVEPVPISSTLHLKSQVTALPDGTVVGFPDLVDQVSAWPRFLAVPEPEGAHVVVLADDTVLMSDAAPRSADLFRSRGLSVIEVDVSEFVKLEGCVTCLSVRQHPFD
nr:arginine deiminase family protein [Ornithinimicrobium cryptoxanthini]